VVLIGEHKDHIVFIVSPEGNDEWSGVAIRPNRERNDGPFRTITRAQARIRELKAQGELNKPVSIYLREGVYFLESPIIFTPEDSGTPQYPITYAAYPGEEPILSGGRLLTQWEGTDTRRWTLVKDKENQPLPIHQLFVNGERRQRAKTPNEGFYTADGMFSADPEHAQFKYRENEIQKDWADRGNVEVFSIAKWAESRIPIQAVEEQSKTVTLAGKVHEWIREDNQRYWIENAEECLDQPGEWFQNFETGMLYYIPLPNERIQNKEVIVSVLPQLVLFQGTPEEDRYVRYIKLEGLTFSHTDWSLPKTGYPDMQAAYDIPATIAAVGAHHCTIQKCLLTRIGNYAIEFSQGCQENKIIGNVMTDLGAGGIRIGEPNRRTQTSLLTMKNTVSDNSISDIGKVYPAAVGVWIGQSGYNLVSHNEIFDTYYTAISVGWTWGYGLTNAQFNIIEYNHCYNLGRGLLSDMGGIYTLGSQNGTVIRNNIFHDIESHSYGGWGIYPDEGSSHIVIENNITYNTKSAGFHQHYGKQNIIRNNIFAYGKEKQVMRTRNEPHLSFTFERNIVIWNTGDLLGSNWQDNNYTFDNNLYWFEESKEFKFDQWTFDEWKQKGQDSHSLIADPFFRDPQNADFTLPADSPAHKIGFQPIDFSEVGPRMEQRRPMLSAS
jgi:hypothetical protein